MHIGKPVMTSIFIARAAVFSNLSLAVNYISRCQLSFKFKERVAIFLLSCPFKCLTLSPCVIYEYACLSIDMLAFLSTCLHGSLPACTCLPEDAATLFEFQVASDLVKG